MRRLLIAGVVAGLAAAGAAHAEVYLGGAAASSSYDYSDVGNGAGSQLFLGYRVDGFPLMFEAEAFTAGHPKIDDFTDSSGDTFRDGKLGFKGTSYSAGYFGSQARLKLGYWGKVGYYTGKAHFSGVATVSGTPVFLEDEQDVSGVMFGLGAQYMFTPWFGAMLQVEGYERVNDYKDFDPDHKGSVTFASAGLVLAFPPFRGERQAPPPRHHEARKPSSAPILQNQVLEPHPPAAAPPGPPAAGDTRTLPAGFLLRGRPMADSEGVTLDADMTVTLATRLEKPDGAWWFVRGEKRIGWVPEQILPAR